ncbi:MAG TPA: hypothetical protein VMV52_09550, partial [Candidatus Nanopelagicaceae bacterium]|nr:hypothetical protein [Candidatus Nanopelagicaceae bacterium]
DRFDLDLIAGRGGTTDERLGDINSLDLDRGLRRARAAALLMLALPGNAYLYQGEELGLPEVRDIPENRLQDPIWHLSGFKDRGRDGCRVPMPWRTGDKGGYGFSTDSALTPQDQWLPQPKAWANLAIDQQLSESGSTLKLYQEALALRRQLFRSNEDSLLWRLATGDQLLFERSGKFACLTTFGTPTRLPDGWEAILSSSPLSGDHLPPDCTVWLRSLS